MTQKEKEKNKCENVGTTSAQDGHDGGGGGQRVYLVPTLHRQKFQGRTSSFNKKTYVLLLKALNGGIVASHGGGGGLMSMDMGIWLHGCLWLGSFIILTHVHRCKLVFI